MPAPILRTASVALLMAVALTSCTPSGSPTPDVVFDDGPTVVEIFGSEDAAAAAAEEALDAYWAASAEVYQNPEAGSGPLAPLVTQEQLESEDKLVQAFLDQSFTQHGEVTVDSIRYLALTGSEPLTLTISACADYSEQAVVRSDGRLAERKADHDRFQHVVTFHVADGSKLALDFIEIREQKQC